jgi:hypothetical protein
MDLNNARRLGKQPYQAVRDQFDQLGERVIERHWDAGAPVRQGYRRFLGALDELAGKLLDDDEIAQRGQDLLRENEADGTAGNARLAAEGGETGAAPSERTVDVVFSLPAGTEADHVALCGEFNDWSPETTTLTRGDDRAWRVTVPLVPGTYRYKFLLDGETWENGPDADHFEENAYGTSDSVIVVAE